MSDAKASNGHQISELFENKEDGKFTLVLHPCEEMIAGGLAQLSKNLPDQFDTPEELAEKFTICESALAQIKEYASAGLKARGQGSLDVAEDLLKGQANHSLQDFAEDKDTKITIEHEGESVTVTPQQLSQAVNELERQRAGGD